jgi:putative ABC transport system permease protein
MRRLRIFIKRLRGLIFKRGLELDLEDEIRLHLELQIEENMRQGMGAEEARRAALRKFGGVAQIKENYRDRSTLPAIETVLQDLRYGLRMLRKSPGWTAVMGATLALGIGLTTAIFSLAYGILLRALPYSDPERLVSISLTNTIAASVGIPHFGVNSANWLEWREQTRSFEEIALAKADADFNLTGGGPPERVRGARASWNLTRVLGVPPLLGRMFTEEETLRGVKVAVLSYSFWDRRFARDPAILGHSIQLDGESFEVIGVLPPNFHYPSNDFELLAPLFIPLDEARAWGHFYYKALGRLKPGVSMEQAQAELITITQRLARRYPPRQGAGPAGQDGAWVESLLDGTVGGFRTTIYLLVASVGCLLLIGCINLGGLLIVRASARTHEFAIRAALGASAGRLRRQTIAEALPLSIAGAAGGVLLAWMLLKLLLPLLPQRLPGLESVGLHGPVLLFALALSLLVVLLAGMLPARLAARIHLSGIIQQGSRTVAGGAGLRNALVTAQIAVTLVLIFASGLLVHSLVAIMQVDPGFSPQGVLTMHLQVARTKYPTDIQVADYYRRLVERVRTVPGVIEAGMASLLPFSSGRPSGPVEFEGKRIEGTVPAEFCSVTPGYFSAQGIPIIRGRDFSDRDKAEMPPVAIIDERLARSVFGDTDPLGKRIKFAVITDSTPWIEIIGVVGHIRSESLEIDQLPQLYWPKAQPRPETQRTQERGALIVRTAASPELFASTILDQIHKENPDQPVYDVRTMEDWLGRSLRSRNLLTGLVMLFGVSALLLACLGLYGVVSYGAGLRLREFAIRTALGAQPGDIRRLVLAHAARLWLQGSAIGLIAAWPAGRALQSQLYSVGSADVIALLSAPFLLFLITIVAGFGPARRAGRVDPAVTLRAD